MDHTSMAPAPPATTYLAAPGGWKRPLREFVPHPIAAIAAFLLDTLLFGCNISTFGCLTPIVAVFGFALSSAFTFFVQLATGEPIERTLLKSTVAGLAVALPANGIGAIFFLASVIAYWPDEQDAMGVAP